MRASEKYLKPVLLDPSESRVLHLKNTIPSDTVLEGGKQDGAEIEAKYEVVDEERDEEDEPDDIAPAEKEEAADLDFESISAFISNSSAFANPKMRFLNAIKTIALLGAFVVDTTVSASPILGNVTLHDAVPKTYTSIKGIAIPPDTKLLPPTTDVERGRYLYLVRLKDDLPDEVLKSHHLLLKYMNNPWDGGRYNTSKYRLQPWPSYDGVFDGKALRAIGAREEVYFISPKDPSQFGQVQGDVKKFGDGYQS
ncbi:hypothetical protein K4K49_002003 [Colletotrichum sp. SAR 10_70]|nr:hypothetical protein K4K50_001512 [Colletotrichum sp. SAR 10_71]KAI8178133.1 hypothetical protein K4K49_002003 [Colletotrichum sp. SAR 10_70]KAI8178718.1 hypothetical protein KHU50_003310 [Colletotrichum sp. SAR 10_65]KAI8229370.1 hypothetical protein K4K54_001548 [Colletotrichum sp. SAR 10_86]